MMANPLYGQNKADNAIDNGTLKTETIDAAGALSTSIPVSIIASEGVIAITLAASPVVGQIKHIFMSVDGGTATLTIAQVIGAGNTVEFASIGDSITLVNQGSDLGWCMVSRESGTANAVDAFDGPAVSTA